MVNNFNNKYSHSTLSKFDIIGSYFVNLYYNEFYIKAKNLKTNGSYNNITEAYKNILSSYVEFSNHQDFFKQIVKGIHTYCISTTRHTTMSHKECIDFMVSEFVPTNLWNSLRENQKNKLFHESLISCIKIFTEKIITNHLHIIIDNHSQEENITILQDLFLTIILLEKDKIFSKFINPNKDVTLDLFKTKLQKFIIEKKELINLNKSLNNKLLILNELNKKNSKIILELQKNNKILITELQNIKKSNIEYKNKNTLLNNKIIEINKSNQEKNINMKQKLNNSTIINKISQKNNTSINKYNNDLNTEFYNESNNESSNEFTNDLNTEFDNESNNGSSNEFTNDLNTEFDNVFDNESNNEFDNVFDNESNNDANNNVNNDANNDANNESINISKNVNIISDLVFEDNDDNYYDE